MPGQKSLISINSRWFLAAVFLPAMAAVAGVPSSTSPDPRSNPMKTERPSYDPLPPAWNIPMNQPGWLAVGAQYCTQRGQCQVVGEGPGGLGPIPLKGGGTAPPSIGCRENPEYPACVSGRLPVQLLARSAANAVIVKLNGRNYAVGGMEWAYEKPDGTAIGGPIMVQNPDGEILPLHYALRGMTKAAHDQADAQLHERRKRALAGILKIRGERCDELVSVAKPSEGSFVATCRVGGAQKEYTEGISGLE